MIFFKSNKKKHMVILYVFCSLLLFSSSIFADWKLSKGKKAQVQQFFSQLACNDCHGGTAKIPIRAARYQYDLSGHNKGGHSFYANGGVCMRCHTHEGFIDYITTKRIDPKGYISYPSQPGCFTCHDPHARGDLSSRTVEPVKLVTGETFNLGKGNLCAHCHSALSRSEDLVKATPAKDIQAFWGSHHGPQADMIAGTNGYEYKGKSYSNSKHSTEIKDSCVECHMTFPKGRFAYSPDMAGHSFSMSGEVHHRPTLNNAGCLGDCHKEMNQTVLEDQNTPQKSFFWHQAGAVFDIKAVADFDNDNKIEPLQAEIEGLLNRFVNVKGTGYLQKGRDPMYKKDGSWNWSKSSSARSKNLVAALYNYKFVLEDRSRGIHNASYAIQLLYDSIQSLDPKFNVSKRNAYAK